MSKQVHVINPIGSKQHGKLPVAAYCRVSSNSDDQRHSFAAQVKAYTAEIESNSDWTLAGIYADKGITGTSAKKRPEFNRLMEDCRKGKIKRILVKSVSRFARNTKECLEYVRELKALGVSVYFEDKKIDTGHFSSEMLLAMLGSVAQEESVSISNNMRWSYEKRMQKGEFNTNYPPFGYRVQNGQLVICDEEATVVKWLFESYLNGMGQNELAQSLAAWGYLKEGKQTVWSTRVQYILQNERYMGDALLQKKYTIAAMPSIEKRNKGEVAQYYVQNANPAIISREAFQKAQELRKRRRHTQRASVASPLKRKIECEVCASVFRRKDRASGAVSWVCNTHDNNKNHCPVLPVAEPVIENTFLRMFALLQGNTSQILRPMLRQLQQFQEKTAMGNADINELNKTIVSLSNQIHGLNRLRAKGFMEPATFQENLNVLNAQLDAARSQRQSLIVGQGEEQAIERTEELIEIIEHAPDGLASLEDGEVFSMMVDKVLIDKNKRIVFRLINGLELVGDGGVTDG